MSRRVPVIHQLNAFECGAACLAMILEYFGRKTRLEECRARCDPGRNGTSVRTILSAAAHFGLLGRAFAVKPSELGTVPLPCIVFWNRSHFVVLERWSRSGAEIVDPEEGCRQMSAAEFEAGFSGVALRLEPGPDFKLQSTAGPDPSWAFLRRIVRTPGLRPLIARILGLSLLLQGFGFLVPLLTKTLIDTALPGARLDLVELLAIGSAVLALFSGAMSYLRAYALLKLETTIDGTLMDDFVRHLLSLPFRFFQLRSSGDLMMRLSSNAAIREALASYSATAILDGLLVVVFLAALVAVCYPAALVAVTIAAIEISVLAAAAKRTKRLVAHHIACQSTAQSNIVESLMGISTVKATGAEESVLVRWSDLLGKQLKSAYTRGVSSARVESTLMAIRTLSPLLLLCLGAKLVIEGSLTAGTMLAVNAMAAAFLQPVSSVVMSGQRLYFTRAHLERIADVMQSRPEQDREKVKPAPPLTGHIEIRNLWFRYDAHSPDVLSNINLTIRPGQKVALVGRTGSGKSTLAKLLLGLYVPNEGEILYDGAPLESLNLQTVRQQWGVALQEPFLFSSSLRENLALCHAGLAEAEMIRAAELAEIHADIQAMPMGYETRLDEAGHSLSGGQRQRIAIARAVAGSPSLLLLDEATSHLDTITERAVDRNLDTLHCTRVVIAHRLSTIQNADLIVVLEDGRIAEQGTHEELVDRDGVYAALVRPHSAEAVTV